MDGNSGNRQILRFVRSTDMKTVAIVYKTSSNMNAMNFVKSNLEGIFEDFVRFYNVHLEEYPENSVLHADAYLVSGDDLYEQLKERVDNFSMVVKMERSPNVRALKSISEIPSGTKVLLVNDSYETALSTAYSFYEMGVSHINFVPFDNSLDHTGIYDDITIAVTPNEPELVPEHISEVIDIGYRVVSFDTVVKLKQLLDLEAERINRNIFRYLHTVVESATSFYSNFIYDYLKSEMIKRIVDGSAIGTILVDALFEPVYANAKACSIFGVSDKTELNLSENLPPDIISSPDVSGAKVTINLNNYILNKYTITLMDEKAGYYMTLQDERDTAPLRHSLKEKGYVANYQFSDIIYRASCMEKVISTAKRIAGTDLTVLIRGESGTGKEMIAQSIHNYSDRSTFPFVAVNCAALPETLLESELFGYEAGSFTGARSKGKAGLFEQAHRGTIFLDEIGDISPKLQSRLLRTIQEMQVMRIGSDKVINIDVRIIAATNKNLEAEIAKGSFRSDLFFRLNVLPVSVPPLRERKEDIPALLKSFLGPYYKNVSPHEKTLMMKYDWPGNVRELRNTAVYYKSLSELPEYLVNIENTRSGQEQSETQKQDSYSGQAASHAEIPSYNGDVPVRGGIFNPPEPKRYTIRRLSFTEDELKQKVLSLIYDNSAPAHGVGRTVLVQILKSSGVNISDGKLREILSALSSDGLIQIGRGRFGTRITEMGIDRLKR